ncbi:hypothetical protein H6F42_00155 [Pseudanabaena sp. FACHB-1998]|uniref:hypothetical protein n=1 Tax=Pseudanabaena sp. FACHB-1998 TaxID=2692858 RepID=UPI0016811473|nr:hypothetical protein [Pseudanabaena sp. FACHB-1998]MBD2175327.1 hypothetical protein [Pseudanabaena sp. FACHB-1998]
MILAIAISIFYLEKAIAFPTLRLYLMRIKYSLTLSVGTSVTLLLYPAKIQAQFDPNLINQQIPQSLVDSPNNSPNINIPTSNFPLGDINQQGGIINNNGLSGQQINCGRACLYFYSDFSKNDARFGAGINIPLFAPENELTTAQSKKTLYDVESGYIKSISEACQTKDIVRAELSAKGLARIWQVDYKTLLRPSCG